MNSHKFGIRGPKYIPHFDAENVFIKDPFTEDSR